jgi:hypothetical protein
MKELTQKRDMVKELNVYSVLATVIDLNSKYLEHKIR